MFQIGNNSSYCVTEVQVCLELPFEPDQESHLWNRKVGFVECNRHDHMAEQQVYAEVFGQERSRVVWESIQQENIYI